MTNKITIEEIKRLDAERTQGEWVTAGDAVGAKNDGKDGGVFVVCGMAMEIVRADRPKRIANQEFIAAAPDITALAIRQDVEIKTLKLQQVDYRQMVAELQNYCQPLRIGTPGRRHSTNLIEDHKRQAEENGSLQHQLHILMQDYLEWKAKAQAADKELEQLRQENGQLSSMLTEVKKKCRSTESVEEVMSVIADYDSSGFHDDFTWKKNANND